MKTEQAHLLTRTEFREKTLSKFQGKCAFCNNFAVDAHHIMERRLFANGGYYLDNGSPVCEEHHLLCEQTLISTEQVRSACNIQKTILPEHFYSDLNYDKWGNIILENGQRSPGELFGDPSVQKILKQANLLNLFSHKIKYPRTYHLPWSLGMNSDDRIMQNTNDFIGKRVIVTEKMDGENTTWYNDCTHARSIDSKNHPSRNWMKSFWAQKGHSIPPGWRVCGENLFAKHSIAYENLSSFFFAFSIWDETQNCLSWDDTKEWMQLLDIPLVPILYDDIYDEKKIKKLWNQSKYDTCEGYVLRSAEAFHQKDFNKKVGKFVRNNHVQQDSHWFFGKKIIPNKLST